MKPTLQDVIDGKADADEAISIVSEFNLEQIKKHGLDVAHFDGMAFWWQRESDEEAK
jgi:hypothetical protein